MVHFIPVFCYAFSLVVGWFCCTFVLLCSSSFLCSPVMESASDLPPTNQPPLQGTATRHHQSRDEYQTAGAKKASGGQQWRRRGGGGGMDSYGGASRQHNCREDMQLVRELVSVSIFRKNLLTLASEGVSCHGIQYQQTLVEPHLLREVQSP